jgi:hypothetical protein
LPLFYRFHSQKWRRSSVWCGRNGNHRVECELSEVTGLAGKRQIARVSSAARRALVDTPWRPSPGRIWNQICFMVHLLKRGLTRLWLDPGALICTVVQKFGVYWWPCGLSVRLSLLTGTEMIATSLWPWCA